MENKKGIIEIQFNWIFVLAIGAVILLFFSVIIIRQKNISEVSTSNLILKNLEGILSGAEVSLGTVNLVNIPKTKIEFECNTYRIGKVSKQFGVMSIFVPSIIESNKLITWTLDWSLPYRVTNLLYLTSPKIRYIFVGETGCILSNTCFAKKVFNLTPKEIRKELMEIGDVSSINDEGDNQIRIILFDTGSFPTVPSDIQGKKEVTLLYVIGGEDKGDIDFYTSSGTTFNLVDRSHYLKQPTLLGAIFADDIEIYECIMETAFKKLNIVSKIYKKKTEDLRDHYTSQGDTTCAEQHNDAIGIIGTIETASRAFSETNINIINTEIVILEDKNKEAQLYSCALIY